MEQGARELTTTAVRIMTIDHLDGWVPLLTIVQNVIHLDIKQKLMYDVNIIHMQVHHFNPFGFSFGVSFRF